MKNILIVGPPRSGKTVLATTISKEIPLYNIISTDVIRSAIWEGLFKTVDKKEKKQIVKNAFPQIINKMIEMYCKFYNPKTFYVLEGDELSIEDAFEISKKNGIDIVCVGTPNIKANEFFKRIRDYSVKHRCWTDECSDSELLELCEELINRSKEEAKFAKANGITYLDTSYDLNCLSEYVRKIQ